MTKTMELTEEEAAQIERLRGASAGSEAGSGPLVHVWLLLDRTGSMMSIRDDVIGGVNSLLADQRKIDAPCVFTLAQFDSQGYEILREAEPIRETQDLRQEEFVPRASTPLYDAIGRSVRGADDWMAANPGAQMLFVTMTDGLENASREFTLEQVKELTEQRKASGWTFAYLGANQDAYAVGAGLGVAHGSAQTFVATSAGTRAAGQSLSDAVSTYRGAAQSGSTPDPDEFWGRKS